MKRIISAFLICLLIFSLCSCKTPDIGAQSGGTGNTTVESTPSNNTEGTTAEEKPESSEKPKGESGTTESGGGSGNGSEQNNTTESGGGSPTPPPIESGTEIISHHTALTKEEYYQYSFLTPSQKKLYDAMYEAAELGINNINTASIPLTRDDAVKVYKAFTADNPQFFYVCKHYSYTISESTAAILEFTLYYSDGVTEDDFDKNGNRTAVANRAAISRQKAEFDKKIGEILASIPSNVSQVEIERLIYEYVCDNVDYDSEAAESVKNGDEIVTNSFDAYGAACKGVAVCEGYTKLFQYLCYRTGINATQVLGADGTYHMWNAVLIDGKWYFTDTTWDDTDETGFYFYRFFNTTAAEVADDHPFDSSTLTVPGCTATDAAFYNVFALCPTRNELPDNYKQITDSTIKHGSRFLCVYSSEPFESVDAFITLQIQNPRSLVKQYISEKGYPIKIGGYRYLGNYYYIELTKTA